MPNFDFEVKFLEASAIHTENPLR